MSSIVEVTLNTVGADAELRLSCTDGLVISVKAETEDGEDDGD
jgi:hypothetical protein